MDWDAKIQFVRGLCQYNPAREIRGTLRENCGGLVGWRRSILRKRESRSADPREQGYILPIVTQISSSDPYRLICFGLVGDSD